MSGEPAYQIDVSFRNFKFTRGFAIKDTTDVLTELLTNACDAYNTLDPNNLLTKDIWIIFHHVAKSGGGYDDYIQLIDNALGVEPSRMKDCFLVAGAKTSSEQARGFFSTGAKNITVMGDVHYTSIRDNKLSKVYLDDEAYGHIVTHGSYSSDPTVIPEVTSVVPTEKQRNALGIQHNGLNVVLRYTNTTETSKFTSLNTINDMLSSLAKVASLRGIFSNPKFNIYKDIRSSAPLINVLNTDLYALPTIHTDYSSYLRGSMTDNYGGLYYGRLTYEYPVGKLMFSTTFVVPDFPQYNAKFVMYKADAPIPQPVKENQMEFGFLLKDSKSIHEVSTLDDRYRWNPNINYIYGYVQCEGFRTELIKYDNGETDELILDPNRVGGLNHSHTLYKKLMEFCLPRLDKVITDVQQDTSFQTVNIKELDSIVSKLEELGVDIFNENEVTVKFAPDNSGDIVLALNKTENNIVSEIAGTVNVDIRGHDDAVVDNIQKREAENTTGQQYVYYINNNDEVSQVPVPKNFYDDNFLDNLHDVVDKISDISVQRPYIYRLENGEWTKTEIYIRGKLDRVSEPDDGIKIVRKSLTIQFINDINYIEKYIVDTTNGIVIKINMHNKLVSDKLSKLNIGSKLEGTQFVLSNNASYDALQFLEGLMIDALTDIVVDSDIKKGKLVLDDPLTAGGKVLDYWIKKCAQVETLIHALFTQYAVQKKIEMKADVINSVVIAKDRIVQLHLNPSTTLDEFEAGAQLLADAIVKKVTDFF